MNTHELVIIRTFNAPRERVWQAWTDAERMMRWWGPKDFTAPFCAIDLRVGGKYLNCMRSAEGKEYWGTGAYREIVAPERGPDSLKPWVNLITIRGAVTP